MADPQSVIDNIIERLRLTLEEAKADKYPDSYVLRQVVQSAYSTVWSDLNMGREDPVCLRYAIDVQANTKFIVLPPMVQEVWRMATLTDDGMIEKEWWPQGQNHPCGPGWFLESNMLGFRPYPQGIETWSIWYVPSGDCYLHKGTATAGAEETVDGVTGIWEFTLGATPSLGILDRRDSAYAGAAFRTLDDDLPLIERASESYDPRTRLLRLRYPIATADTNGAGEDIDYEIAPIGATAMIDAIAARAAKSLGVARNVDQKKMLYLDHEYLRHKKTLNDRYGNLNIKKGKHQERYTRENENYHLNPFGT